MQQTTRQRFDRPLQLQQCETGRHEFEHHRPVFDFRAQPGNPGRQNTPVVMRHGLTMDDVAACFRHQPRFPQRLIALQDQLLIPTLTLQTEIDRDPPPAPPPRFAVFRRFGPADQSLCKRLIVPVGGEAPVFPWKKFIPIAPACSRFAGDRRLPRQTKVTHGNDALIQTTRPARVREGIKLLHIAKRVMSLPLHPQTQTRLQRTLSGLKRARRQGAAFVNCQYARLSSGHRDDHRD